MTGEPTGRPTDLSDSFYGLLSGQTEDDRRNLEILLRTIVELSSSLHPKAMLESIVDRALAFADAERGFLLLHDRRGELTVRAARDRDGAELPPDLARSRSIPEEVAQTGKVVALSDLDVAPGVDPRQSITGAKLRHILCGPLRVRGRTIGVLYVDSRTKARPFSNSDRGLFKALCYELAFALELANLAQKEQALAIARGIQESLLPGSDLHRPGLDLHGVMRPCEEAGGDYFDYLTLRDGRLGLVLGDVTGHGVGAALLMATCRTLFRTVVSMEPDLARALNRANRDLCEDLAQDQFLSLFLAEVDVEAGEVRYTRAGHASPLHLHADTGKFSEFERRGLPMGVVDGYEYRLAGPVRVRKGDILVLFTDGVEETRRGDELFGLDRIRQIVIELSDQPARRIAEQLIERVLEFSGESPIEDDLTVVVARFV